MNFANTKAKNSRVQKISRIWYTNIPKFDNLKETKGKKICELLKIRIWRWVKKFDVVNIKRSLSFSTWRREKKNEQFSGGHFVFPARWAVLICLVNSEPGTRVIRFSTRGSMREEWVTPKACSHQESHRHRRRAITGRRVKWQVVRHHLS